MHVISNSMFPIEVLTIDSLASLDTKWCIIGFGIDLNVNMTGNAQRAYWIIWTVSEVQFLLVLMMCCHL